MSTASSMHLVLVDSPPMTPNDSAQNENGANILENVKQTDNNKSDCIQSDSKNTTPKCTPKVTPNGTPKDTPKGTPKGSPRGTPKSTPRHEVEIGNKTTETSTDNVIYDWGSKQTAADLSSESDQSYDVPIPKVPSSSNSDNDQNITSNESSQSEFPPALTNDSDDHDEIFTNQADHLGKFYIKLSTYTLTTIGNSSSVT